MDAVVTGPITSVDVSQPFEFTRHPELIIQGFTSNGSLRLGSFYVEGTAQFLERIDHDDEQVVYPKWVTTGGVYFRDKLFSKHLDVKMGMHGRVFTGFHSREFDQQALAYLPDGQSSDILRTGIIDLVILAHLGDAYVHFIWDNLLDRRYVMTSFYPMPERQLRFGVSWEFFN